MNDVNNVGKTLFDKKTITILEATKNEALSIKEISKKISEPAASLYYPVKKLLDIQALKIVREEKVKNLIEYYYTSKHLFLKDTIVYEGDVLEDNKDQLIQSYLFEVNKAVQALNKDILLQSKDPSDIKSTAELSFVTKTLSYEGWKEINQQIRELIDNYEEINDSAQTDYNFLITSYKYTE